MSMADGSTNNDAFGYWKGISAFYAIGLCEALHHHSDLLTPETIEKWKKRIRELTDYVVPYIDNMLSAVNYKMALPATLAFAGKILGDEEYIKSAKEHAKIVYNYITPDNLLFGEPKSGEFISEKGCYRVDIGYNVEESIYLLLQYAELLGDQKMKDLVEKPNANLIVSANMPIVKRQHLGERNFNHCGGFETYYAEIEIRENTSCEVVITAQAK